MPNLVLVSPLEQFCIALEVSHLTMFSYTCIIIYSHISLLAGEVEAKGLHQRKSCFPKQKMKFKYEKIICSQVGKVKHRNLVEMARTFPLAIVKLIRLR